MSSTPHPGEVPALPNPREEHAPKSIRPVLFAAVIGGGLCLALVIIGLTALGLHNNQDEQISSTGLASIGAALAGGFAAWIGRTVVGAHEPAPKETQPTEPLDE